MLQIKGIRILGETLRRTGGSGDNWHMTWAGDGRQYAAMCDGSGWPGIEGYTGQDYNTRVLAIENDPPNPVFRHLPGFPDLHNQWNTMECSRYYGFGIIALDGCIYHFLSTPNHPFHLPEPRFVGAKLIYSPDNGRTWRNQNGAALRWEEWQERNRGNMVFFEEPGEAFALLTVLQMGRGYEHNIDGYVYVFAPNGNRPDTMRQMVMFRVRKESILHRTEYEFFVSHNPDGSAAWSRDMGKRGIVCEFPPGWVNTRIHPYAWHPSIIYNAPLGIYMMANWGMGCDADGLWFGKPSYLGYWIADRPWGPWRQIHEETAWIPLGDLQARAYQPQISPKWIAEDGRSFWMVFTDFQMVDGARPYYCFNYQKVEVITD